MANHLKIESWRPRGFQPFELASGSTQ